MMCFQITVIKLLFLFFFTVLGDQIDEKNSDLYPAISSQEVDKCCAFVTIHYEGTPDDDGYLLGVRVLMKSIQLTNSKYDFIVLTSPGVRQSSIDILKSEGAVIRPIENIENPYKNDPSRRDSYKDRFEYTFNKLYLWDMIEYDRVIYMDADNLILHSIDSLFNCGAFCSVYYNQLNFHTGMMVIKPDRDVFNDLVYSLTKLESYDGADQGFLCEYFKDMIDAPIFKPFEQTTPLTTKMNRLPLNVNLHAAYYQQRASWNFYKTVPFNNLPLSFGLYDIPALSLDYPIGHLCKPWNWFCYVFFDMNWVWTTVRSELGDSNIKDIFSSCIGTIIYTVISYLIWKSGYLSRLSQIYTRFMTLRFSLMIVCIALTGISFFLTFYGMVLTLHANYGWSLFVILYIINLFITSRSLLRINNSEDEISLKSHKAWYCFIIFGLLGNQALTMDLFPNFIVKLVSMGMYWYSLCNFAYYILKSDLSESEKHTKINYTLLNKDVLP